jgi:hypothetical protein
VERDQDADRDGELLKDGDELIDPLADEPPPEPTFVGQIVRRRSWPLIGLVFVFALLLAVAPLLYSFERNTYAEAISLYDRLCSARQEGDATTFREGLTRRAAGLNQAEIAFLMSRLDCVDRRPARPVLEPAKPEAGGGEDAYAFAIPASSVRLTFRMESGSLVWDPW